MWCGGDKLQGVAVDQGAEAWSRWREESEVGLAMAGPRMSAMDRGPGHRLGGVNGSTIRPTMLGCLHLVQGQSLDRAEVNSAFSHFKLLP